jgi:hypothetical protein
VQELVSKLIRLASLTPGRRFHEHPGEFYSRLQFINGVNTTARFLLKWLAQRQLQPLPGNNHKENWDWEPAPPLPVRMARYVLANTHGNMYTGTHKMIADATQSCRENVSINIRKWVRKGWVKQDRRRQIEILNTEALKKIAQES